jgi:hypothetical protein
MVTTEGERADQRSLQVETPSSWALATFTAQVVDDVYLGWLDTK